MGPQPLSLFLFLPLNARDPEFRMEQHQAPQGHGKSRPRPGSCKLDCQQPSPPPCWAKATQCKVPKLALVLGLFIGNFAYGYLYDSSRIDTGVARPWFGMTRCVLTGLQ